MSEHVIINQHAERISKYADDNSVSYKQRSSWLKSAITQVGAKYPITNQFQSVNILKNIDYIVCPRNYLYSDQAMLMAVQGGYSKTYLTQSKRYIDLDFANLFNDYLISDSLLYNYELYNSKGNNARNVPINVRKQSVYGVSENILPLNVVYDADRTEGLVFDGYAQISDAHTDILFLQNPLAINEIGIQIDAILYQFNSVDDVTIGNSAVLTAVNLVSAINSNFQATNIYAIRSGQYVSVYKIQTEIDPISGDEFTIDIPCLVSSVNDDDSEYISIENYDSINTADEFTTNKIFDYLEMSELDYICRASDIQMDKDIRKNCKDRAIEIKRTFFDDIGHQSL